MKMNNRSITAFLFALTACFAQSSFAALECVSPINGETVRLLPEMQRKVLAIETLEERIEFFKNNRQSAADENLWRRSSPLVLECRATEDEHGPWKVFIGKRPDLSDARIFYGRTAKVDKTTGRETAQAEAKPSVRIEVPRANLEIGTRYYWKVSCRTLCGFGCHKNHGCEPSKRYSESSVAEFVTEDLAPRWIALEGKVENVRDFGGRNGLGGRRVKQGMIYRGQGLNYNSANGDEPGTSRLTVEDVKYLTGTLGIKTDLDLRGAGETAGLSVSPLGEDVKLVINSSACYRWMFIKEGKASVAENFRVLSDPANYPVFFHCIGGADRTGSLAYMMNAVLGVSRRETETDWESTFYPNIPDENPDPDFWCRESHFNEGFGKYGDKDTSWDQRVILYLKDCGVTDEQLESFRSIMLEGHEPERAQASPAPVTDVAAACRDSLIKTLPAVLSRIRRHAGDKTLAYYGPGESGHWAVQMNQQVAAALAVLADTPEAELEAAGLSSKELYDTALALFRYSLRTHSTGDVKCTDGRSWGRTWISVLGLERSVAGALLLGSRFSDDDRARLKGILVDESLFRLEHYPVKAGVFRNNVPESNLWNGSVMFRTAWSYPDLADSKALLEKASRLMLNGLSSPADSHEKWFVGANFSENWALDHHGYMNVGYMYECLSNLAFLYFDCLEQGRKVPPELMHNAEDLWRVCKRLTFPDGRICRIGGDTRSRHTYCQLFAKQGWLFAAHALKDEDAIRFEREYLAQMISEQNANADGSYFGTRLANIRDASFYYYCRLEADALLAVATALHWHRRHKFPSAKGPVDISRVEAWHDEGEHAVFLRGPKSFRSAVFRSQAGFNQRGQMPNIMCVPASRGDLADWSGNLVGKIGLQMENDGWSGTPDGWPTNAVKECFYRDEGGEAFEQTFVTPVSEGARFGEGEHGDGIATRSMEIHAVGDGTTMAIRDRVEINRVFQLEHGWSAGRLVVPAALTGGKKRSYIGLGTHCVTVDDALSLISVTGGPVTMLKNQNIAFNHFGERRFMHPLVSGSSDVLRTSFCDKPVLAEGGSVLYDEVYIVVAGADAVAARKVSESVSWNGKRLVFTGTDGIRRALDLDFVPGKDDDRYDPKAVSRRITEQFLSSVPEDYRPAGFAAPGWLGNGYGWKKWIFYATASLWATALDNARQFGERDLEKRLVSAFEPYLGEKSYLLDPKFHVDYNVVGAVPLAVARLTGDARARKKGLELADFQWKAPDAKTEIIAGFATLEKCREWWKNGYTGQTRLWIDDMYMINLLQTEAYKLTGDEKYIRRSAREMVLYLDKLQRKDGLFNHAPDVPYVWGRGAGWMAAGMPLILSQMKSGDEFYDRIYAGYRKMMDRLLECQRADGLWGQLVDDPESWPESSGSAMFAYAIASGLRHGWLKGEKWRDSVDRAWRALCDRIDGLGNISDVCIGTNKKNDREYYLARGRAVGDPHGQAPMLWLAGVLGR